MNPKFKRTPGLIHYWPFFKNTHDIIDEADLYGGVNARLTYDRFNKSDSAISLTNGYYKLPPRVYFNSSYSFLIWAKLKVSTTWARIFDISNQAPNDVVVFAFNAVPSGGISNVYYDKTTSKWTLNAMSSIKLELNRWYHIAFVLNYPNLFIYINGTKLFTNTATNVPNNVKRTFNFVGRSTSYPADADVNADYDEIKIFNRALSQDELLFEMNNEIFV